MSGQAVALLSAQTTSAALLPPVSGAMAHTVTKLDSAIKGRRDTDEPLINWWLYVPLVGPFTFGIYAIVLYFKRIDRVDGFSEPKRAYCESLLDGRPEGERGHGR